MTEALKLIAMNCRGLADRLKRKDVLNYIRSKSPDIVLLQDIHVSEEKVNVFLNEWGFEGIVSPGASNARGTAILFNNTFEYVIHNTFRDTDGNYVLVDISVLNQRISLGSIYGPSKDKPDFYQNIFQLLEDMKNEEILIGGDWNLVMNPNKDYSNYRQVNNSRARATVLRQMRAFNMIDIWRHLHEHDKKYTWRTEKFRKQARLDFYLMSESLKYLTLDSNIESGYRTDHSMITLKLSKEIDKKGKGIWKFNVALLRDKEYDKIVKQTVKECVESYALLPYDRSN